MKTNIFSWDNKGGRGPWGQGARSSGQQADIDDMIRNAQDRLGRMMGSGGGGGSHDSRGNNRKLWAVASVVAVALWLASGFYIVDQSEQGVVLRFGKYVQTTTPGLNYHLPWPVETVLLPKVERENRVEIGFRSANRTASPFNRAPVDRRTLENESLMLTGDENIVDLDFNVRWKIKSAENFLFNVYDPELTIKFVAESAMREIIGKHPIDDALTSNKAEIETATRDLIQSVLDGYKAGVQVNAVELQQVNPPEQVIDAFKDVQAARADAEKLQNEAIGYSNDILPRARGDAARIIQEAEGYKQAKVSEASGQADRFLKQLSAYSKAKSITEKRLYLEAMEDVMKKAHVVVMGAEAGRGVLPYLPLGQAVKGGK